MRRHHAERKLRWKPTADIGSLTMTGRTHGSRLLLKEILELFGCQTSIVNDATHRVSINWIVARNCEYPPAITHDHMLTLTHDPETSLLKRTNRPKMRNPWNLWHARW